MKDLLIKIEKEFLEKIAKYFVWLDASGIHGADRYKAYAQFIEVELHKNNLQVIERCVEMAEENQQKCPQGHTECVELKPAYNNALTSLANELRDLTK